MFKSLKDKLGSWIKKAKEKLSEKPIEETEEITEEEVEKETEEEPTVEEEKETEEIIEEALEEPKKEEEVEKKEPSEKPLSVLEKEPIIEEEKETEEIIEEALEEPKKEEEKKPEKKGFLARVKSSLKYKISESDFKELFEDLELGLLENNVAMEVVEAIGSSLEKDLVGKEIKKDDLEKEIKIGLKKAMQDIIIEPDNILDTIKAVRGEKPFVILFFGINGAGKTTSLAKFSNLLKKEGITSVLAAADTFRAASMEQLQIHADKLGVKMIKHDYGSDPSAVAYDAIEYAKAHKIDVVLVDTAGRMHTKEDLLREMEKIVRVSNPDLKVFVAESIAGNDATEQAKAFNDAIEIDGTILTKTDVDEKGGTIISISHAISKPIFYLATGQGYDDLEPFNKDDFISKLGLDE